MAEREEKVQFLCKGRGPPTYFYIIELFVIFIIFLQAVEEARVAWWELSAQIIEFVHHILIMKVFF